MRERLTQAVGEVQDGTLLAADATVMACLDRATVEGTLETIRNSLVAGKGALLTGGELRTMRDQLEIFGLHTARLDLRQHSSFHEAAVAEVLGQPFYPRLGEPEKIKLLLTAMRRRGCLTAPSRAGKFSPATRDVLDPLALGARARRRWAPRRSGFTSSA